MLAIVRLQLGRHALQFTAEEHVQEEGFHDVVAMMAERDLGCAQFGGDPVQDAAPQARAQRAGGLAFRNQALDDAVGILVFDMVGDTQLVQVGRQDMVGEIRLFLIQVYRDDLEIDRRPFAQGHQDIQQGVTILAAGQADHHLVAVLDHIEIADRLANLAAQALVQLIVFVRDFLYAFLAWGARGAISRRQR